MKRGNNFYIVIVSVIIIGALCSREYAKVGLIITLTGVGIYVLSDIRRSIGYIRRFRHEGTYQRIKAVTTISLVAICVIAAFNLNVYYFMLLALLAIDYLTADKLPQR